jgi:hypothetical protein
MSQMTGEAVEENGAQIEKVARRSGPITDREPTD